MTLSVSPHLLSRFAGQCGTDDLKSLFISRQISTYPSLPRFLPYTLSHEYGAHHYSQLHGNSVSALLREAKAHVHLSKLDPNIRSVLTQIAPGQRCQDIPWLVSPDVAGIVAFDDSWTLLAWSRWWHERCARGRLAKLVILHADDHEDLKSPYLRAIDGRWSDILTGAPVALGDPESIAAAIMSTAIGIGSFMVPMIHVFPQLEIRHLYPRPRPSIRRWFAGSLVAEDRDVPASARLAVQEKVAEAKCSQLVSYIGTSNPEEWVHEIAGTAALLLHIDLDYFNDRYAGGRIRTECHNPNQDAIKADIRSLCNALANSSIAGRIENTSIALSPGFCPSEHWAMMLWHLGAGLRSIGCVCPIGQDESLDQSRDAQRRK